MTPEATTKTQGVHPKKFTIEDIKKSPFFDEKGNLGGLKEGNLWIERKGNFVIRARSRVKFVFQIILGILVYAMTLSTVMILRMEVSTYVQLLMMMIAVSIVGATFSIVLYLFYPLIAPRVFDFHHGVFYTKPLSFYIYLVFWDSIHIVPLETIHAIQIIRTESLDWMGRTCTVDQTNIILKNGNRTPLMIHENAPIEQTKEDAQRLATRLVIPVWDMSIVKE